MTTALQILLGGVLQGSIFALLAIGFSLVYRVTGIVNLAQGAFCVLAALAMYTCETTFGWGILPSAVAALAATALFGAILGATTFVPALTTLPNSSMLMLTVGLLTLIEGAILVIWGSQPYSLPPFSGEAPVVIAGVRVVPQGFWVVGSSALVILALWLVLTRTTLGKALRACSDNPSAARLMGVDVERMRLLSFTLAGVIGGLGGIMVAPVTSLEFDTGHFFTNSGFMAVAIGGMGSYIGAIGGGLLLGVTAQLAAGYVSSLFSNALTLGLLLITLLWRPNGLFSSKGSHRSDAREELRVQRAIVRLNGPRAKLYAAAALALALALPWMVGSGVLSSLVITGILFIAVIGLDLLMGYTGQVSLGQAGFMAIGGYTSAILATQYDWSPLAGTVAGMAFSLVCAIVVSLITMRLRGVYLALATLAFGLLVDSLAVGMTETTGGPSGLVGIPSFSVGAMDFSSPMSMYYLLVGIIVVLLLLLLGGIRSGFGRAIQAIRTDQMAAAAFGVNVLRYKLAVFCISAVLASLAGSLYAFFFHFLSPEMVGTTRSFEMISMLVIGGEGTLIGPVLGTALLTLLPTIFQPFAIYKTMAEGLLLVLAFRFLPAGLFGTAVVWFDRLGKRKAFGGLATGGIVKKSLS
jgi:branched-chain amino acid transport system permease protein